MSVASLFLLAVLAVTLLVDYAKFRRHRGRIVLVELMVFACGGVFVAYPALSTRIAAMVGIGRGVDFVLYLALIWLVRESILSRVARWEDGERFTGIVRALAIRSARKRSELP
jgi:hypothetical protein